MTTLHQLTDNCLAVAGLSETVNRWINPSLPNFLHVGDLHGDAYSFELPTGNWRILGKANELTEDELKEALYTHRIGNDISFLGYDNFQDIIYTATESGASLLKLHQLENPLILIKEW